MNNTVEFDVRNDQSHLDQTERLTEMEERLAKLTQKLEELQIQNIFEMEVVAADLENRFDGFLSQLDQDMTNIKSIHELALNTLRTAPSFPEQFVDPMDLFITDLERNINEFKSILGHKAENLKTILMIAKNYSIIPDEIKTGEAVFIFSSKASEIAGLSGTIVREMANIDKSVTTTINYIDTMLEKFSEEATADSSLDLPSPEQSQINQAKTYLEFLKTILIKITPLSSMKQGELVSARLDNLVARILKISVE